MTLEEFIDALFVVAQGNSSSLDYQVVFSDEAPVGSVAMDRENGQIFLIEETQGEES